MVTPLPGHGDKLTVVWTRGKGCLELAEALGGGDTGRVSGDLVESCIRHKADVLVSKKLPSGFDLVNVVVPVDFEPDRVTKVDSSPEADIEPMVTLGVPGIGLDVDGSRYFWYHHTDGDTLDKLDPAEMGRCVALMAVMAYVIADLPERLPS